MMPSDVNSSPKLVRPMPISATRGGKIEQLNIVGTRQSGESSHKQSDGKVAPRRDVRLKPKCYPPKTMFRCKEQTEKGSYSASRPS